ncbi:4'-phosphopantetheinyl transferase family protein, partial [Streptomyces clavuligerus]|uniref:4'-phosphopantetheinyl transferase family protein n=1 Tax=Streptomyces clavuligerus TaxID=1901 RepID=UPI0018D0CC0E
TGPVGGAGPLLVAADWTGRQPPTALLGPWERRHAEALPPRRRRQFTAGRLTARAALGLAHGTAPPPLDIPADGNGAPYPVPWTGRALSISHTGTWAASAIGPPGALVGVDIERADACDPALLRRVFAPGEAPPPSARTATAHWARKEAALKAHRGTPPTLGHYRVDGDHVLVHGKENVPAVRTWEIPLPGLVLVVASGADDPPVHHILTGARILRLLGADRAPGRRPAERP